MSCLYQFLLRSFGVVFPDSCPYFLKSFYFRYLFFQLLCSFRLSIEHFLVFLKHSVITFHCVFDLYTFHIFMLWYLYLSSAFPFTYICSLFLFLCWSTHIFNFCRILFSFLVEFLLIFLLWIWFDVQPKICLNYLFCILYYLIWFLLVFLFLSFFIPLQSFIEEMLLVLLRYFSNILFVLSISVFTTPFFQFHRPLFLFNIFLCKCCYSMPDFLKPQFHNSSYFIFLFVDIFHDFFLIVFISLNFFLNSNLFNSSDLYQLWFYITPISCF